MITIETTKSMTMEQAMFLAKLLPGPHQAEPAFKLAKALELMYKADSFEAHRIISHVLSHTMSDENNALYVADQLGLGG